ncbi:hypothetical protein [Pantanalinema sp. GBBB05]|uniref:hypothetical protein n=1 Tax=Pantanalinema sp. GBBB05 TaxID=2604139 RepID=UPI001D23CCB6|nr:hypothetical protein [Pantanalinema sp. GBBB05]
MLLIREIVKESLASGYLSLEAEDKLRQLLKTKYDAHDLKAFMVLQKAVISGVVRQESRELHEQAIAVAS